MAEFKGCSEKIVKKNIMDAIEEHHDSKIYKKWEKSGKKGELIVEDTTKYEWTYPKNTIEIYEHVLDGVTRVPLLHHIFYVNDELVPQIITDHNKMNNKKIVWVRQEELRKKYTLLDPNKEVHV